MRARLELRRLLLSFLLAPILFGTAVLADGEATRLLRFPDVHEDFVVFVYSGDLWRASSDGGTARRLTAHAGLELFPKISPDGKQIAFTAEYTGSRQVFVMPADGGASRQLTFYNDVGAMPPRGGYDNWIMDWTPDGKILVRMNRTPWGQRMGRYFVVDPAGGLERPLELPEGGSASLSPDGAQIAYCPVSREFRTWKRTRGGRAQDIWIYDFDQKQSTQLTESVATENFPMWSGKTIYFTGDADSRLQLYAHDLPSGRQRRLTTFDTFDVLWPSLGPDAIVFVNDGYLHRFDLERETSRMIPIRVESDMPLRAPYFKSLAEDADSATLSPSGSRVVVEARGELFSVPAKNGPTRNLTRTSGIREMSPTWSPDGLWIAYLSDATGEYEVYVRDQMGTEPARQLTRDGSVWRFPPTWSPDSLRLAFGDRDRRLWILEVSSGKLTEVDRGERGDLDTYVWSPDSRRLAYQTTHPSRMNGIAVYSLDSEQVTLLGDGLTNDYSPAFSDDGKHLFFVSDRDYNLRFSSLEFNYIYDRSARVYAVALDPATPALFPPRSDEEKPADNSDDESDAENGKKKKKKKSDKTESVLLDPEGWVARTVALPGIPAGNYGAVATNQKAVFYLRGDGNGPPDLLRFDLEERTEASVLEGVNGYELSADGEKLLYTDGGEWGIVAAGADQEKGKSAVDLSQMRIKIDPLDEWKQMFEDAWRIGRDWFYDPGMHGKDWDAIGDRYRAWIPDVAHRADLDFVFGELISELDAGHTYVQSGDEPEIERVTGGMLGCELEPSDSGFYRIAKIFPGENWDDAFRSPLTEPGVAIREGEYLLAIDGEVLSTDVNPYALLEDKANRPVVLRVADRPSLEAGRDVTVRPVASELDLRYLDWVKGRMKLADELSGGRVGYVHLPNTAFEGNRMLQKLFYSQVTKPALIVDDRYNGGGFIPDRMIEYLTRRTMVYWARRDVESMRTPGFAHDGPKAMLINGYSSSGGDALPYFFKLNDLGPIIGTRTWGGLIGLTGNPSLVDGGTILYPTFRIYDTSGRWVVENAGVEPDLEVVDLPELRIAGGDPSLEKAVSVLLEQLDRDPVGDPPVPTPPDMAH